MAMLCYAKKLNGRYKSWEETRIVGFPLEKISELAGGIQRPITYALSSVYDSRTRIIT